MKKIIGFGLSLLIFVSVGVLEAKADSCTGGAIDGTIYEVPSTNPLGDSTVWIRFIDSSGTTDYYLAVNPTTANYYWTIPNCGTAQVSVILGHKIRGNWVQAVFNHTVTSQQFYNDVFQFLVS